MAADMTFVVYSGTDVTTDVTPPSLAIGNINLRFV